MYPGVSELKDKADCRYALVVETAKRARQLVEGAQPLIAKFYRPARWSNAQILEEHAFTRELAEHELPVVAPIINQTGEVLHDYQGFRFSLYPRKGGHAPELDNLDHLKTLGLLLGRIHLVGSCRSFVQRPKLDSQSYGHNCVAFIGEKFIPIEYRESYLSLTRDLLQLIDERFAQLTAVRNIRGHGDCHSGNMLWRDQAPHFVDFDDSRMAPAIQDLWMLLSGTQIQQRQQMTSILEGYHQFNDFNFQELQLIEPLRTLRMIHYSAWLAKRWDDPAFPRTFPWFNSLQYWGEHILELREQMSVLQEPPLSL